MFDTVKYIGNQYNLNFTSGWSKFSKTSSIGNRAKINSSWDWLSIYFYEFSMGSLEINGGVYYFKIVHQADTGFEDSNKKTKINKLDVEQFQASDKSKSRLYFVLSKDIKGCPVKSILKSHLSADTNDTINKDNWLAVPYDMGRFINQQSTDTVLKEFNNICKSTFGVELINTI